MTFPTKADKERVIHNISEAIGVLMDVPDAALDLKAWAQAPGPLRAPECGTLYCAAGHLTQHPHFAKFMALVPCPDSESVITQEPSTDPSDLGLYEVVDGVPQTHKWNGWDWLRNHFGPQAMNRCFAPRGEGVLDLMHPLRIDEGSFYSCTFPKDYGDKNLALWRLNEQLKRVIDMPVKGETE